MTIAKTFSTALVLALAVAAVGCAADSPGAGDDDGGGGGGGGGGGDDEPGPMDAAGKYQLRSTLDLATNVPGTAGQVVNTIIAATDGGNDPADWILEQAINAMPSGFFKSTLNGARPFVAGFINQRLLDAAPDFVSVMVQAGHDFGVVAKNFSLNETFELVPSGTGYTAVRSVVGAHFKIDNVERDYAFSAFSIPNTVVSNVGVTVDDTGLVKIADHRVALPYGKVMRMALDGAIIPSLDSSADNLGELLQHLINCQVIGEAINDAIVDTIGFGPGAGTFTSACNTGLAASANFIYAKVDGIDSSGLELGVTGTAKALDKNGDRKFDTIQTGKWTGNLSYGGTPTPLNATFSGARQ